MGNTITVCIFLPPSHFTVSVFFQKDDNNPLRVEGTIRTSLSSLVRHSFHASFKKTLYIPVTFCHYSIWYIDIKTPNVYFRRIVLAPGIVGPRWGGWTHSVALQFITRPEEVETNWWTELKKKLGWWWSLMRWTVTCHRYEIRFISLLVRFIYIATFTNRPYICWKRTTNWCSGHFQQMVSEWRRLTFLKKWCSFRSEEMIWNQMITFIFSSFYIRFAFLLPCYLLNNGI